MHYSGRAVVSTLDGLTFAAFAGMGYPAAVRVLTSQVPLEFWCSGQNPASLHTMRGAVCIPEASIRLRASVQGEEQCLKAMARTVGALNSLNWRGYCDVALNGLLRLRPTSFCMGSVHDQPPVS